MLKCFLNWTQQTTDYFKKRFPHKQKTNKTTDWFWYCSQFYPTCWIFLEKFLLDFSKVTSNRLVAEEKTNYANFPPTLWKMYIRSKPPTLSLFYLHPSWFCTGEDVLVLFQQAANPLQGQVWNIMSYPFNTESQSTKSGSMFFFSMCFF